MNHVCGRATCLLLKAGDQLFKNSPFLSSWWFFLQKNIHKGEPWVFVRMCSCKLLKDWVESGYKKKCPLLYVAHDLRFQVLDGLWWNPIPVKCCMHLNSSNFMVWRNQLVWWLRWGRAPMLWAKLGLTPRWLMQEFFPASTEVVTGVFEICELVDLQLLVVSKQVVMKTWRGLVRCQG